MSPPRVLLVTGSDQQPEGWQAAAGDLTTVRNRDVRSALDHGGIDVAVVDAASSDPVATVRALRSADPAVQAVVLTRGGDRPRVERALLFAPGIGETWVRESIDDGVIAEAAAVTRQRRSYRAVQQQLSTIAMHAPSDAARPVVSDAYLAALLQVLPDPAIALDAELRVVYWGAAAEAMIGSSAEQAAGRHVREAIPAQVDWAAFVARAERAPAREKIRVGGSNGERVVVAALTPILLRSRAGHVLLLHDITAERAAQAQLEAQADELESQAAELEMQAVELQQIAAQREELLEERERTLADLRHAMEVRTRFYASMNHEIRTPINAVLGYTDLLVSGTYGPMPENQLHALEQSQRAARHLIEIVNDLLDLSKLEAGRMDMQLSPVHLPQLVDELLATTRPLAAEHGSELRVETAICADRIITDARRLRQVLINLLSNAAKFGEGKPITIRCAPSENGVAIEVQDRGVGISRDDLPKIFEEFVQVGGGQRGGTGLGLPISRRLAELLGGRLTATSTPGAGSTFRLELPLRPPGFFGPDGEPDEGPPG